MKGCSIELENEKSVEKCEYMCIHEDNIKKVKDFLSICISNYCSTSPILHNSDLKTTKEDKKMHGIGLKNVKAVVSKHNGLMKNEYKDSKFIVDVVL